MKNLSFAEKNNFVIKHKNGKYFSKDLELFKKHFPIHRLNNELARANIYTHDRLDSQMLYVLLEKISPEEILENRIEKEYPPEQALISNIEEAKERLVKMEIDPEKVSEEFLGTFIGNSVENFMTMFNHLKGNLVGESKIMTLSIPPEDNAKSEEQITESSDPVTKNQENVTEESKSVNKGIEELKKRISALKESCEFNEDEISSLRSELEDKDLIIEEFQSKIEALEKKAFNKKKANGKSSQE
jgi:chromosome segregation ATPase